MYNGVEIVFSKGVCRMSVETLENVLTLLVVIVGSLYSIFKYINSPKREWLYISVFFMTHLLSDYYWTTFTLVMGENPDVSAMMAYFGWNIGYLFLAVSILRMSSEECRTYIHPMMFIPVPLGIWQFIIYLPFGGLANNIWEGVCATTILCLCLQALLYYSENKKNGATFPWFHLVALFHIIFEYGMWTSSCFNWPSEVLNPYHYFAFLDCFAILIMGWAASKVFEARGFVPTKRTPQETRFSVLMQIMTAVFIFFGTVGGYYIGRRMKSTLSGDSADIRNIAITLFVVSIVLVVFSLMVIVMTSVRYKSMEGNSDKGNAKKRGRFNFIFTIIITLCLMTASVLYTSRLFHKVSVAGALEDGQAKVKSTAEELENYLAVARSVLWVTADTVEIMLQDDEAQDNIIKYIYAQTANQKQQFDENFTGLYAYIRGEYMDGSGWVPPDDYRVESRDWYKDAVDANGKTIIVSPYVDADTGSVVLTICKLLKDGKSPGDYQNRAVVALDLVVNHVQEVTEDVSVGGKGYAMVLNQDGLIISHRNSSENGKNIVDKYGFGLLDKLLEVKDGSLETTLNGEKQTLFINSVLDQWYVVIVVSESQLLSETNNQLVVNVVVSLIVFLLITFFYYLGYKNEQLNAGKMEELRSNALKREYEAQVFRQKEAAADEANKAKSNFLAQMSHEIRTPINAVLGMNEMILRKTDDQEILEYSESIDSAGKTLLALINSILDFSKIEDGKMDIIPANYETGTFIKDLVNSIIQRAEAKGLQFKTDIDENLPSVLFGDDVRLTQVVMNLLTNAVKYTEKGSVTLAVKCLEKNNRRIKLFVAVRDTGIGIKPDDIDKLAVSFERLEEKRNRNIEGTGLGMSIVTSILELMGSKICVDSTYGVGSVFSFTVEQGIVDATPLGNFADSFETDRSDRSKDDLVQAPSARVLVVDDNALNIKVATNLLKLCKIEPDAVETGMEAVSMLGQKTYDIVFLDHMMPVMDGIETLHEMQNKSLIPPETKIIVLTANAIAGAKDGYIKEGFDDYLSKPIEIRELVDILRKYLPESAYAESEESDNGLEVLEFAPETEESTSYGEYDMDKLRGAGVDTEAGIRYCADDSGMYFEMLDFFVASHDEKKNAINGFYEQKNWPEYRILIHALKGNFRTLGMPDISEKALALENASAEGDEAFILGHHEEVMADYDHMSEVISAAKK